MLRPLWFCNYPYKGLGRLQAEVLAATQGAPEYLRILALMKNLADWCSLCNLCTVMADFSFKTNSNEVDKGTKMGQPKAVSACSNDEEN